MNVFGPIRTGVLGIPVGRTKFGGRSDDVLLLERPLIKSVEPYRLGTVAVLAVFLKKPVKAIPVVRQRQRIRDRDQRRADFHRSGDLDVTKIMELRLSRW